MTGSAGKTSSAAPPTLPESSAGLERLEVDQLAAGAVDDPHPVLHLRDRFGIDPVDRVGRLRQVDGHDVRLGVEVVGRLGALDAQLAEALRGDELVEGDHLHLERLGPLGDQLADPAEPDHAERLAVQLVAGESRPRPLAADQRGVRLGDVAAQGQSQRQGVLGGGHRVRLGGVDDHDARAWWRRPRRRCRRRSPRGRSPSASSRARSGPRSAWWPTGSRSRRTRRFARRSSPSDISSPSSTSKSARRSSTPESAIFSLTRTFGLASATDRGRGSRRPRRTRAGRRPRPPPARRRGRDRAAPSPAR